jgi:hypothetical protein
MQIAADSVRDKHTSSGRDLRRSGASGTRALKRSVGDLALPTERLLARPYEHPQKPGAAQRPRLGLHHRHSTPLRG